MSVLTDLDRMLSILTGQKLTVDGSLRARAAYALDTLHGQLDQGYGSRASGAPPVERSNVYDTQLTATERGAERALAGTVDPARVDMDQIVRLSLIAMNALVKLDELVNEHAAKRPIVKEECPDGWCVSCYRDDQRHTDIDKLGLDVYDSLCRWCGRFEKQWGRVPSLKIIQKHHSTHPRITAALLAQEGFK